VITKRPSCVDMVDLTEEEMVEGLVLEEEEMVEMEEMVEGLVLEEEEMEEMEVVEVVDVTVPQGREAAKCVLSIDV